MSCRLRRWSYLISRHLRTSCCVRYLILFGTVEGGPALRTIETDDGSALLMRSPVKEHDPNPRFRVGYTTDPETDPVPDLPNSTKSVTKMRRNLAQPNLSSCRKCPTAHCRAAC